MHFIIDCNLTSYLLLEARVRCYVPWHQPMTAAHF